MPSGVKRREWKSGHGYRAFFKTKAEQVMKPANVELLSGRTIGISNCYYKPTQGQILEDFLRAVPLLTINDEFLLKIENHELREQNKDSDCFIQTKLEEIKAQISRLKLNH